MTYRVAILTVKFMGGSMPTKAQLTKDVRALSSELEETRKIVQLKVQTVSTLNHYLDKALNHQAERSYELHIWDQFLFYLSDQQLDYEKYTHAKLMRLFALYSAGCDTGRSWDNDSQKKAEYELLRSAGS